MQKKAGAVTNKHAGKDGLKGARLKTPLAAFSFFALVAVALTVFLQNSNTATLTLHGLDADAIVDIRIETDSGAQTFQMANGDSVLELQAPHLSAPYRIMATARIQGNQYRDFDISVGRNGLLSATIDSFQAWDVVSIDIDGQSVMRETKADWSGKLEYSHPDSLHAKTRICVNVNSEKGELSLCHSIGTTVVS